MDHFNTARTRRILRISLPEGDRKNICKYTGNRPLTTASVIPRRGYRTERGLTQYSSVAASLGLTCASRPLPGSSRAQAASNGHQTLNKSQAAALSKFPYSTFLRTSALARSWNYVETHNSVRYLLAIFLGVGVLLPGDVSMWLDASDADKTLSPACAEHNGLAVMLKERRSGLDPEMQPTIMHPNLGDHTDGGNLINAAAGRLRTRHSRSVFFTRVRGGPPLVLRASTVTANKYIDRRSQITGRQTSFQPNGSFEIELKYEPTGGGGKSGRTLPADCGVGDVMQRVYSILRAGDGVRGDGRWLSLLMATGKSKMRRSIPIVHPAYCASLIDLTVSRRRVTDPMTRGLPGVPGIRVQAGPSSSFGDASVSKKAGGWAVALTKSERERGARTRRGRMCVDGVITVQCEPCHLTLGWTVMPIPSRSASSTHPSSSFGDASVSKKAGGWAVALTKSERERGARTRRSPNSAEPSGVSLTTPLRPTTKKALHQELWTK
ncbi:hypothetical protein C8R43DRAFT_955547 [Mycena crocata]|nr:hypothetical protein C8R43DRAFT_955547 [Mycena crocata]